MLSIAIKKFSGGIMEQGSISAENAIRLIHLLCWRRLCRSLNQKIILLSHKMIMDFWININIFRVINSGSFMVIFIIFNVNMEKYSLIKVILNFILRIITRSNKDYIFEINEMVRTHMIPLCKCETCNTVLLIFLLLIRRRSET